MTSRRLPSALPSGEIDGVKITFLNDVEEKIPPPNGEPQMKVTPEQAQAALDDMDDFARMQTGVDAIGARSVLSRFITQHTPRKDWNWHPTVKLIDTMKMLVILAGVAVAIFAVGIGVGVGLHSIVGCSKVAVAATSK